MVKYFLLFVLNITDYPYLCGVNQKRKEYKMARPIKETPILYGEDAQRLLEAMKNVVPETPEKMAEMKADYDYFMSIFEDDDERNGKKAG